jgi:hypothetical protein
VKGLAREHLSVAAAQMIQPGYVPSVEEVLLCRIRTTGITSQE